MAVPTLSPKNTTSEVVLTSTGSTSDVAAALPYGIYSANANFISGAVDQVAYTFKKLGGDVLDIELTNGNVYAAYEESVLEYSYLVNIHQAKNSLGDMLGNTTASFDQDGEISSGQSLSGSNIQLKYPRFTFQYSQRVGEGIASEANVGGNLTVYSASFATTSSVQDYDLQNIVSASSEAGGVPYANLVGNKRIKIRQMYFTTPYSMWRFYGYYGGLNVTGDMHTYGQYADDSSFQVIPVWQNKIQAIQYEDHLYTRTSHYSYEIQDNKLRIYPTPNNLSPKSSFE